MDDAMNPKPKKIPAAVYLRYTLLNLPGLAGFILVLLLVQRWLALPEWLSWVLIAGWIVKDVVLLPVVWRAYDWDASNATGTLVGERGITKRRLDRTGYIQVRGELWKAERTDDGPPIEAGRFVRIHKMQGLTLFVVPEEVQDG